MPMTGNSVLSPMGQLCRTVAATLIAGVWRRHPAAEIEARIKRLGTAEQTGVVGGVLGLMFLCSLFAAQFGILGVLLFWLGVILLVR